MEINWKSFLRLTALFHSLLAISPCLGLLSEEKVDVQIYVCLDKVFECLSSFSIEGQLKREEGPENKAAEQASMQQ